MTFPLRQSTNSQEIPLGYFLDSGDGNTEESGLTIANTDISLFKHGSTGLVTKNDTSGATSMSTSGVYYTTLNATDTNTLGGLVLYCHPSGALAVRQECFVYPADIFDALFGTSLLKSNITQYLGNAVPTANSSGVPVVDVARFNGNLTPVVRLALSAGVIVSGTAQTGTLSTTQMTTDLTQATTDHYKGRIIIWTSGSLIDQATDITAYNGTGGLLTFTAVTDIPANNDTFIIV